MTGTVKWFSTKKGFGFITGPNGRDVFLHHKEVIGRGFKDFAEGEIVEYDLEETEKGLRAVRVVKPDCDHRRLRRSAGVHPANSR